MPEYDLEAVDKLPFSTPEKAQRYQTENYRGAMGLNWYLTDPTLQFIMAYYLRPDELAFAEPHLTRIGELTGGASDALGRGNRPQPPAARTLRPVGA
ncbi:Putative acyl-CoA dehydrogenase FadE35 [Mycobacterium tuberculosis]|nr:Putative acyl-CoA dehydrogenase FadE35 [Mycobacterium tuberculosis]